MKKWNITIITTITMLVIQSCSLNSNVDLEQSNISKKLQDGSGMVESGISFSGGFGVGGENSTRNNGDRR